MGPEVPDNVDMTDSNAVFELAKRYHKNGEFELAMRYYLIAADLDHPTAFNNIGYMYSNGEGVEKSNSIALEWYEKSMEHGSAVGAYNLGLN